MTEIIFWVSLGAIMGILAATLVVALCKTVARCSPEEQARRDNEQMAEVSKWNLLNQPVWYEQDETGIYYTPKEVAGKKWQAREDYYGGDE